MAEVFQQGGYQGSYVGGFQFYLQRSNEHSVIKAMMNQVLPEEFKKLAERKSDLSVLGVGSGGGELDVHLLSLLQSTLPSASLRAEIIEPSAELAHNFQELVSKTLSLQNVPFDWHAVTCSEYESQVRRQRAIKKFDFISMIQMLYYVEDPAATIKFFHSLLHDEGRLLIVHEAAGGGWETMWKAFKMELCTRSLSDYLSAGDVKLQLDALGLRYEEQLLVNTLDISPCFDENSEEGALLLNFMTDSEDFRSSFPPELRRSMLEVLKERCSSVQNGRVMFDCSVTAFIVYA